MTKYDVKNYLEKIYNVPVGVIRTRIQFGESSHFFALKQACNFFRIWSDCTVSHCFAKYHHVIARVGLISLFLLFGMKVCSLSSKWDTNTIVFLAFLLFLIFIFIVIFCFSSDKCGNDS